MAKYKIQEEIIYGQSNGFYILKKTYWFSIWKYLRNTDKLPLKFKNRKAAQAYLNFNVKDKK